MSVTPVYQVVILPSFFRDLKTVRKDMDKNIVDAAEKLAQDPRPPGAKMLKNRDGEFRLRVGDYRIIYEINDTEIKVLVLRVGHRSDVYSL